MHPTKSQLNGHLVSISQIIWERSSIFVEHSRRNKEELTSNVLLCTSIHGHTRSLRAWIQQIYENIGCHLPGAIENHEDWSDEDLCNWHALMLCVSFDKIFVFFVSCYSSHLAIYSSHLDIVSGLLDKTTTILATRQTGKV